MKEVQSSNYLRALGSDLPDRTHLKGFFDNKNPRETKHETNQNLNHIQNIPIKTVCVSEDEFLGNSRF